MKLTTKSEYSLLSLVYMARHEKSGFVKLENICAAYDIPQKYLEQLLYVLKGSHYVRTRRGKSGGYRLAKPAGKISVAEIVRLMDGALAPIESVSKYFYSYSKIENEKKLMKVMAKIRNFVANTLEHLTLKDLV